MTYLQLSAILSIMTKEQLCTDVTIYLSDKDEYYKVGDNDFSMADDMVEDRLDHGHFFLIVYEECE